MNKPAARAYLRARLRELPDEAVRNLMGHAANETPIICDRRVVDTWVEDGAG